MSTIINVRVRGADEARQMMRSMGKNFPVIISNKTRKMVNNVVVDLKNNMDSSFQHQRTNGLKSNVRIRNNGFLAYQILMPDYAVHVDTGTYPHPVSRKRREGLFRSWERAVGVRSLPTAIFIRGTNATNFIKKTKRNSIPRRYKEFENEFLSELRSKMKGGR